MDMKSRPGSPHRHPAAYGRELSAFERAVRRFGPSRAKIDALFDGLRLKVDTFPYRVYQPMPSLGLKSAAREAATASRFEAMLPILERTGTEDAVDLGCNFGWYVLQLAERGIATVGIEDSPPAYRSALLAARRSGASNIGILAMRITPHTAALIPSADAVLMLSLWHHFVRSFGLAGATEMLETIWGRARRVLVFESGEDEMGDEFGLPAFEPDARTWLSRYLETTCQGSDVLHLGLHDAFDADARPCRRNLFAVVRTN
jgi:SAM-dependent methyltransferase